MISVIIPIYNAEKTLYDTLTSIKEQTYKDIEVIMINDGSVDHSESICEKFVEIDQRFKYFYQNNQGVSVARNNGLKYATGKFITYIDSDDLIGKDYCKVLHEYSKEYDIVICDVVIKTQGKEVKRFTMKNISLTSKDALNELFIRKNINSGPCGKLFRKNIIANIEFPILKTYEDILFNMEAFQKSNRIFVTNRIEYDYIQNPNGAMSKMFHMPSQDIIKATDQIMRFIIMHPELDDRCSYITLSHLFQYVQMIVEKGMKKEGEIFLKNSSKLYRKYIRQIIKCSAFPKKEICIFIMYMFGILYYDRKLMFI